MARDVTILNELDDRPYRRREIKVLLDVINQRIGVEGNLCASSQEVD